jgi:hypothetical protein
VVIRVFLSPALRSRDDPARPHSNCAEPSEDEELQKRILTGRTTFARGARIAGERADPSWKDGEWVPDAERLPVPLDSAGRGGVGCVFGSS